MIRIFLSSIALATFLSGCANKVYFGTATSLGVDFSADGAGIGYRNAQAARVPARENGMEFSVLGSSDIDLSLSQIYIDEEFATGKAADSLSMPKSARSITEPATHGDLLFGSYTTASFIDINFGATNPFQGATIGYKRATATMIPIVKDNLRSVYAKTVINSEPWDPATNPCGTKTGGIRFVQLFATGQAAINIAVDNKESLQTGQTLDEPGKNDLCIPD